MVYVVIGSDLVSRQQGHYKVFMNGLMTSFYLPAAKFINSFILRLAMSVASVMLIACTHTVTPSTDSAISSANTAPASKISPLLQSVAQQLLHGTPAADFHGGLVHVDDQGRLQVYVYVNTISPEIVSTLTAKGLTTAMPSPALHLVQGWTKPQDLKVIAALPFVTRITPPKYAQPR